MNEDNIYSITISTHVTWEKKYVDYHFQYDIYEDDPVNDRRRVYNIEVDTGDRKQFKRGTLISYLMYDFDKEKNRYKKSEPFDPDDKREFTKIEYKHLLKLVKEKIKEMNTSDENKHVYGFKTYFKKL